MLQYFLLKIVLTGEEFSAPRDFSEFESNLGEQKVVDVVHSWVGMTPQEIAPGSIPLGSLKNKNYVPAEKLREKREPLVMLNPPEEEITEMPEEQNYPLEFTGEPVPVDSSLPGWVGPLPNELAPMAIPLGSLANSRFVGRSHKSAPPSRAKEDEKEKLFYFNSFFSTRPYYTHNVLRVKDGDDEAAVWENLLGASLSTKPFALGKYVTLVPKLDLMMQVASYEDKEVAGANLKDLLGYRFSLAKAGIGLNFPRDFSLNLGFEYDLLNSLDTGDKMFDAWVPSLRLSKSVTLGDATLLMMDGSMRYSMTERELPNPLPGQFPDDGDNLQLGLSVMLIQLFGAEGQFMIMPSLNISRSEYLNHDNDGRVDWSTTVGLSGSWQATEWLSLELGLTCSILRMNDRGEFLQGASSRYEAYDLGATLMAIYNF